MTVIYGDIKVRIHYLKGNLGKPLVKPLSLHLCGFTDFSWYYYHFEVSVLLVRLDGAPEYRSCFAHIPPGKRLTKLLQRKITIIFFEVRLPR